MKRTQKKESVLSACLPSFLLAGSSNPLLHLVLNPAYLGFKASSFPEIFWDSNTGLGH